MQRSQPVLLKIFFTDRNHFSGDEFGEVAQSHFFVSVSGESLDSWVKKTAANAKLAFSAVSFDPI